MGEVYLAEQVSLGRRVALKVLRREVGQQPGMSERFRREARLLSSVEHPAVVRVIDFGQSQDATCLVMEFAEGETLAVGVKVDLERGAGRRRALEPCLTLQPALPEVEGDVRDLERRAGRLLDGAADQLCVDRHLEEAEVELAPLVLLGPGADVEGEADIGNLQPEVDDVDAGTQLDRRETDECASVQQS